MAENSTDVEDFEMTIVTSALHQSDSNQPPSETTISVQEMDTSIDCFERLLPCLSNNIRLMKFFDSLIPDWKFRIKHTRNYQLIRKSKAIEKKPD